MRTHLNFASAALCTLLAAGCATKQIDEDPLRTIKMGSRVGTADTSVAAARAVSAARRERVAGRRDSIAARALANCAGDVCDALARGELAIGMSEQQVMAATGTTPEAWTVRRSRDAAVMVPAKVDLLPQDRAGNVAFVQLRDDEVTSYSYRESYGLRTVSRPADASSDARNAARSAALVEEGDAMAAAGRLDAALERYDRASVLRPDDAELDYRIATLLDKQFRPTEALMRYQRFLHRMELESIETTGTANAKLADAIARARERVIVIEKEQKTDR